METGVFKCMIRGYLYSKKANYSLAINHPAAT